MMIQIDQVAIAPSDPDRAMELLHEIGIVDWTADRVDAQGVVRGEEASNRAELAFNYDFIPGIEFEVLNYVDGPNFVEGHAPCAAHFGVHVDTMEAMEAVRTKMSAMGIPLIQEVMTRQHTNKAISGLRWYHYVIFGTRDILGVDLKFIRRRSEVE